MIDIATMQRWLEQSGFAVATESSTTLRITHKKKGDHAPFFVQCAENWVLLSMLPLLIEGKTKPDDLGLRLLAANREMRLAKFALDQEGAVVLCAELPTESLDYSELDEATKRMLSYAAALREELYGEG